MASLSSSTLWQKPQTRIGWWAIALGAVFVLMFIVNSAVFMQLTTNSWWQQTLLPFYGIFMVLCGLSGGVVALLALFRWRERSWLVWLSVLPGASMLFLLLGEFLIPH